MYRRIQGFLDNAGPKTLDDLIPLAERNAGKVALTSPLAFLLVAREHYLAFTKHNEDERILQVVNKALNELPSELSWAATKALSKLPSNVSWALKKAPHELPSVLIWALMRALNELPPVVR